ncbi:MAG: DUF5320 domain-containing protein [Clostridiales bacterium]|nr:DUF5320 domain-containing protein [Clostridiales bacterium]
MPGMNRMGPMGSGPMTGRGMGACGANGNRAMYGRRGFGLNRRCWTNQDTSLMITDNPKEVMQKQKEILQREIEEIDNRIKNL